MSRLVSTCPSYFYAHQATQWTASRWRIFFHLESVFSFFTFLPQVAFRSSGPPYRVSHGGGKNVPLSERTIPSIFLLHKRNSTVIEYNTNPYKNIQHDIILVCLFFHIIIYKSYSYIDIIFFYSKTRW